MKKNMKYIILAGIVGLFLILMVDLNPNLLPIDSPIAQNQGQVSSYQFDYQNEAGVISTSKIRNASIGTAQIGAFNFNQGTGGTITLGGTANGNGVMRVLNASGGTVVTADNSGITINNGSMTFKDSGGTTIMDATGLVSSANFANNFVTDANAFSTSNTSLTDVTNMSLSIPLVRTANVLVGASLVGRNNSIDGATTNTMLSVMDIDGTVTGGYMVTPGVAVTGGQDNMTGATMTIVSLGAGTHTLKMRTQAVGGGSAVMPAGNNKTLFYVVLGK